MSDFSSIGPGMNGSGPVGPMGRIPAGSPGAGVNRLAHVHESPEISTTPVNADRVELSDRARFLDMLRQLPDVRHDLVDRVKGAIETDTYETESKLDAAIEQFAREEL